MTITIKQFAQVLIGNYMSWGSTLYDPQNVRPCRSRDKAITCLIDLIRCPNKMYDVWVHSTYYGVAAGSDDMSYDQFKIELPKSLRREWEEEILYMLGGRI